MRFAHRSVSEYLAQSSQRAQKKEIDFRRQSWDEAAEKFHRAIENSPNDGPSRFYAKLCQEYKINPPGDAWDGVIVLEEK